MNATFVEDADGKPRVVRHEHIGLGIAVDMEKSDGSRTLLVPVIRDADTLDFRSFWGAYEELIRKVRSNKLSPDDFAGATVSLTNPGTIGTVQSVPRLMPGQGAHRRRGRARLPGRVAGRRSGHARRPRPVEGHHDQLHLRPPHHPGRRVRAVPEAGRGAAPRRRRLLRRGVPRPRGALRGRAVAARRQPDRPRAGDAREADGGRQPHPPAPRARPPHRRPRPAALARAGHARRARPRHLRAHDLGPRPRVPHRRPRPAASAWRSATSSTSCATRTAAPSASSTCTSRTPRSSAGSRSRSRACRPSCRLEDQRHILERLNAAEAFEKFLATKYVGQKRFGLEGAESAIPILDAILEAAADADLDGSVIGMPHRGRLNVLTNIVGKSYDQIFKEFEGQVDPDSMQGSGDVKYHLGQVGQVRRPAPARTSRSSWPPTRATSRRSTRSSWAWCGPSRTTSTIPRPSRSCRS